MFTNDTFNILFFAMLISGVAFIWFIWRNDNLRRERIEQQNRAAELEIQREKAEKDQRAERERLEMQRELLDRQRYSQREVEEQVYRLRQQLEEQQKNDERRKKEEQERFEKIYTEQSAGMGTGGYIVLDMPKEKRPFFHDLLKGFEDFAKLKGYEVAFSVDSTFAEKIAFKFTLGNDVINISPEQVKADFREYLKKVETGDSLDDMPMVLSSQEHYLLLTTMKNRIIFLQQGYNAQKHVNEIYSSLIGPLATARLLPSPNVLVQTGGIMDSRNYNANNSSHFIQGDSNEYEDNSTTSINIGKSFNDRKDRVEKITQLIELLNQDEKLEKDHKEKAIKNLEKVKTELSDEDQPDKSRISKWLGIVKESLEFLSLGKTAIEVAIILFKAFGLPIPTFPL